jgi:hypothetical protein
MRELEARLCLSAGDLDASFGRDGVLVDATLNSISGLSVQSDGKILLNDGQRIYRRKGDGSADRSFGDDGVITAPIRFLGMKLASDGKILLGGMTNNGWTAARLLADGSPDPTFHAVVKRVTGTFGDAGASGFGVDSQGRILVGGVAADVRRRPERRGRRRQSGIRRSGDHSFQRRRFARHHIRHQRHRERRHSQPIQHDGRGARRQRRDRRAIQFRELNPRRGVRRVRPGGRMAYTSPSDSGGSGLTADNIRASAFLADSTQLLGDEVKGASNVYIGKPGSNDVRIYFSPVDNDGYTDGKINAILPTPDGKILVGGFGGW